MKFYYSILFLLTYSLSLNYEPFVANTLSNIYNHTKSILVLQGKTNHTKCIARRRLNKNDILFSFNDTDIISSKYLELPKKDDIYDYIKSYSNDTLFLNKILTTIYFNYLLSSYSPDSKLKSHLLSLDLSNLKYSSAYWNNKDISDYLLTGKYEYLKKNITDLLAKIFKELTNSINIPYLTNDKYFISLFFYLETFSFIEDDIHILFIPYINICNIYPYYMHYKADNNTRFIDYYYKNKTIYIEKAENDVYHIKAYKDFNLNEQFYFVNNENKMTNNEFLVNIGEVVMNNYYNKYKLNFNLTFPNWKEMNNYFTILKEKKLNLTDYSINNYTNTININAYITDPSENEEITRIFLYYEEWKMIMKKIKGINRQVMTKIFKSYYHLINICSERINNIYKEINGFEKYFEEIRQNNKHNNDINNKIHLFNLENLNFLLRNINELYPYILNRKWKEIDNMRNKYFNIDL